jgi:hypothetical protein
MLTPYPLKAVITDDVGFSTVYNDDPESIHLISGCLSPDEASQLLDQGAVFSSVLFLNGVGKNLLPRLVPAEKDYDKALFPDIVELVLEKQDQNGVAKAHAVLEQGGVRGFFAAGG